RAQTPGFWRAAEGRSVGLGAVHPSCASRSLIDAREAILDRFLQDLKYAARKLVGAPAFTLAAVSTLAIGIGATTAIFSTVNATLLRPLPYSHPEDLIALRTRYADGRVTTGLVAPAELARLNQTPTSSLRSVAISSSPIDVTL